MAQIAGRLSRAYFGATVAVPATKVSKWNVKFPAGFLETTGQGDGTKTYVVDLPDPEVSCEAYYDDTYFALIDAALNGTALKWYGYPNTGSNAIYFYGTLNVSMDSFETGVGAVVSNSFTFKPVDTVKFIHT